MLFSPIFTGAQSDFFPLPPVKDFPLEIISNFDAPRDYGNHEGIDIEIIPGKTEIFAVASGKVIWASDTKFNGFESCYGNHVVIDHGNGFITWYAHLDSMEVKKDSYVAAGDLIGVGGMTGCTSAPHLHFNIQHTGHGMSGYVIPDIIDPTPYTKCWYGVDAFKLIRIAFPLI